MVTATMKEFINPLLKKECKFSITWIYNARSCLLYTSQIEVPMYCELDSKNPVEIAQHAIQEAKAKGYDLVIVDTAGRLAVDEQMMNEIAAIKEAINPNEILFVVDSMTGQDAVNTAKEFNERLDFNGVVLTKLDGDTRGGAALSIRSVVNKPCLLYTSYLSNPPEEPFICIADFQNPHNICGFVGANEGVHTCLLYTSRCV